MESVINILSWILLVAGGVFMVISAYGVNRMPDVYTRLHAASVGDTLGAGLLIAGMMLQAGPTLVTAKLVMILAILFFSSPVAGHALARAALAAGVRPHVDNPEESGEACGPEFDVHAIPHETVREDVKLIPSIGGRMPASRKAAQTNAAKPKAAAKPAVAKPKAAKPKTSKPARTAAKPARKPAKKG
ncbi:MAG: monovalent cation/H(+) antiporter subunit G [Tepidamorphaceae bacterium]|nr:monovalent cation/H(+) antiporter subunit G [Rhodobiaceae bacterium]MCC0048499.1 monovalent cation/H(+) antiporter subunit G [Rhodobiaceae bacterium]